MKTFNQFQESAGDKFKKMTDAQFRDWQKANPGGAEKAQRLRDAARSATPKPTGSGPQLPNVPRQGEVTRADVQGRTAAAQRASSGMGGYRPGVGVTPDFKLDPNFKPPSPPQPLRRAGAGIASRVLPALGRTVVGAVARHPVGAAVVGTGLAAYGGYKLAQRLNQNTRAPKE